MQNNKGNNWNEEHLKDILTREWQTDFASLTNSQLTLLLKNVFYQLLLIDVHEIEVKSKQNQFGNYVNILISGEAYRDPDSLEPYEKELLLEDEEDDEE